MNYTQTKTEVVTRVVKPSDVYTMTEARDNIQCHLKEYNIVDFRPPLNGEQFITATSGGVVVFYAGMPGVDPRFIVVRLPLQKLSEVWE